MNQLAADLAAHVHLRISESHLEPIDTLRGLRLWMDGEIARRLAAKPLLPGCGYCDPAAPRDDSDDAEEAPPARDTRPRERDIERMANSSGCPIIAARCHRHMDSHPTVRERCA